MSSSSTAQAAPPAPPAGLLSRFVGIITAPKATFQTVVAHPRWLGMLALTTLVVAVSSAGPTFTEAGRQATIDQQIAAMESWGRQPGEEEIARLERMAVFYPITMFAGVLIFAPVMLLIMSGILFAVFSAALGGSGTFKQLFAVVVHAGVISALGQLFALPLNIAGGTVSSRTNLMVLLPMLEPDSFAGRLLGTVDLFVIWWVLVLSIGLGVLYRRRTQPIALSLFALYAVIAVLIAVVKGAFGGGQ